MDCRCNEATEFYGNEAEQYARDHLVTDEVRTEAFGELLSCPDTGRRWQLGYDEDGQARLVQTER